MTEQNATTLARGGAVRAMAGVAACVLAVLMALAFALPQKAHAAESGDFLNIADPAQQQEILAKIDLGATCSYKASLVDELANPMQGVNVRIWRVADLSQGFPLAGQFADLPLTYDPTLPGFSWQDAAETLRGMADVHGIAPNAQGATGEDGTVTFAGLATGVYLVVTDAADVAAEDGQTYTFRPAITTLPTVIASEDQVNVEYDVVSDMDKYSPQSEEDVVYSVRKLWDGDVGNESARPESVSVDLYRSSGSTYELYDTVVLNDSNDWFYEWTSDIKYSWTVAETAVAPGYTYTVHVERNFEATPAEASFTVTNTYAPDGDVARFRLEKKWDDKGYESARPVELPVQIYRDGELAEEVKLTEKNGWAYEWTYEKGHVWSVVEALAGNPYECEVKSVGDGDAGQTFIMTNTYSDEETPDEVSYSVTKVWAGSASSSQPAEVTVQLICDGKVHDTVKLNAQNNWTHSWKHEKGHVWTVAEKDVPSGYTATISSKGGAAKGVQHAVTNTPKKNPPGTTTTTRPSPTPGDSSITTTSPLPKTGDTWWPLAPLACAGMACLMIALIAARRMRRRE